MNKKSQDFSIEQAQRLAGSAEGQKQLQKAMDAAGTGNYQEAGKILSSLLSSPEARQLIRQLGGKDGRF